MKAPAMELPVPEGLTFTFEILERVVHDLGRVTHSFMEEQPFTALCTSDVAGASKIYWSELLARVHIGAHLSLGRTRTWLSGVDTAWQAGNALLFAAALRGLLESSADSWFTFRLVPMSLATHHYHIGRAVRGKSKRFHVMAELEEALIHFTHARRLSKGEKAHAPKAHDAMTIQSYLRSLGADYDKIAALYERLCALTHPSAESLFLFVEDYTASTWRLQQWDQKALLAELHTAFYDVFSDMLIRALNLPLTLLKLLNTFNEPSLFTSALQSVDMRQIPAWSQIEQAIERSARTPMRPSPGPRAGDGEDGTGGGQPA